MSADVEHNPAEKSRCWKCESPVRAADDLCPACGAPQPAPDAEGADLFAFFEVPPSLALDPDELQARFHARSRKLHPDRFQKAGADALEYSMDRSALLNKAYRVLRDPAARLAYLLESEKKLLDLGQSKAEERNVPVELAEEYFEMQEALSEGDEAALTRLQARVRELQQENEKALSHFAERWAREGLDEARPLGGAVEARKAFAQDLERALQMKSYLWRMEENIGRAAAGGK